MASCGKDDTADNPGTGGADDLDFDQLPVLPDPTDVKIYVPAASADRYRTASGWTSYSAMITGYNF